MENDQENQQNSQDNPGFSENPSTQPSEVSPTVESSGMSQTLTQDSQTSSPDTSPQVNEDVRSDAQQQSVDPIETPPTGGKSSKMLIAGLVVLAIIAGGVYYFLQLQESQVSEQPPTDTEDLTVPLPVLDPTEGWEVYTGTGFSVKYPGGLIVGEDVSMLNISMWGPTQTEGTELFDGFAVNFILIEGTEYSPQEYAQMLIDELEEAGVSEVIQGPEDYILNEYSGVAYVEEGLGTFRNVILTNENESLLILITIIVADPENLGFQDTVELILSTFTFVNPNQNLIVACEQAGGNWLSEYNECESQESDMGLDEVACQSLGGEFTECHSSCRHDPGYPDDVICPAVCVRVCAF